MKAPLSQRVDFERVSASSVLSQLLRGCWPGAGRGRLRQRGQGGGELLRPAAALRDGVLRLRSASA